MPDYIKQLKVDGSEAQQHLQGIKKSIQSLALQDPDFLMNNFEIDQSYFEIKKLPHQNKIGNEWWMVHLQKHTIWLKMFKAQRSSA